MLTTGSTVGDYTIEGVVGQGGMAVVYKVRHAQIGTVHALKVLTVPKPHIRERLLVEGKAQAAIHHENVVHVQDIVDVENAPALVMEFVDGPTLEALLENEVIDLREAEQIFEGICAGVGEAHARGLVHRDMKPSNVLLKREGDHWVPKVTDFGIAKLVDEREVSGTRTNIAMGTPHYMAPEQIRDAKSVDTRADVFSLGCILYELVSGEKAFQGPDVLAVMNAVASGRFVHPRKHVPDLPDRILRAIQGSLRVDRDARIQSCDQLVEVLKEVSTIDIPDHATGSLSSGEINTTWAGASPTVAPPDSIPAMASPDRGTRLTDPAMTGEGLPSSGMGLGIAASSADTAPRGPWLADDPDGPSGTMRIPSDAPVTPIDPNAKTVPTARERVATPHMTQPSDTAPWVMVWGMLAIVTLLALGSIAAVKQFGGTQPAQATSGTSADPWSGGDEPGLGTIGPAVHEDPVAPVASDTDGDGVVEQPAVLVDPTRPPTVRSTPPSHTNQGLGLFAPSPPSTPGKGLGRLEIVGDAKATVKKGNSTMSAGDLAPGKYDVQASFPNGKIAKLAVELREGIVVRVECTSAWSTCTVVE